MGCFKDSTGQRALPKSLHVFRGKELDWSDLSGTVIDTCEKLAKEKVRSLNT